MHNLRDRVYGGLENAMPYTETFDEALKEAIEDHGQEEERSRDGELVGEARCEEGAPHVWAFATHSRGRWSSRS